VRGSSKVIDIATMAGGLSNKMRTSISLAELSDTSTSQSILRLLRDLACVGVICESLLIAAPLQVSIQKKGIDIRGPSPSPLAPDKVIEAVAAARAEIVRNPKLPEGYLALGRALRIAGDSAAAAKALDDALALNPHLSAAWYEKGMMSLDGGTLVEATDLFRKAVQADSTNTAAHLQLASLLLRTGDWAEARKELDSVLRLDPENPGAHDGLGLIFNQEGNPQEAADEFRKALARSPAFAEAQESLGETLLQLGEWEKARAALEAALAGDLADKSMATYALASALKHLGMDADAKAEFTKARELMLQQVNLDKARSNNDRGLQLWYQGDLEGAEGAFRQALDADGTYAEAHNNLGGVLWQLKKTTEARDEFAAAVRDKPDFAKAHNNLGNALLSEGGEGKDEEAIREFRAAVSADPGFATAHLNLAIALMKKGENSEAQTEITRVLELDPAMAEAHLEQGLLLISESNRLTGEARKELEVSLHLNPDLRFAIPVPVYEELILGD
jgi:tetratricopeptide (TPR) repeat protein